MWLKLDRATQLWTRHEALCWTTTWSASKLVEFFMNWYRLFDQFYYSSTKFSSWTDIDQLSCLTYISVEEKTNNRTNNELEPFRFDLVVLVNGQPCWKTRLNNTTIRVVTQLSNINSDQVVQQHTPTCCPTAYPAYKY